MKELNVLERFNEQDKLDLNNLSIEELMQIKDVISNQVALYGNGHGYIHTIKNVTSNVDGMIDNEIDLDFAKDMNVSVAGNGSLYDRSIDGVIPKAMTTLFKYRKSLKDQMKKEQKLLQKKLEEYDKLKNG